MTNHLKPAISLFKSCLLLIASLCLVWQAEAQPAAPTGLSATGYDSHIELQWDQTPDPSVTGIKIYASPDGQAPYTFVKFVPAPAAYAIDFVGQQNAERFYKITATAAGNQESAFSETVASATYAMSDDELLTMVQRYTFRYFWDFAHPVSGLARERNNTSIVTIGGSGFGVMAILVGIERGFITREQGLQRMLKIVNFLETADRFKGVFPHWMNGATGNVVPFSALDDGGDLVETAFLIQGLLTVRQYFNTDTPDEIILRDKITQIWETVDWNWYRKLVDNRLYWHWSPNHGFAINFALQGFNETHIVYLLAIASPVEVYNVPASLYHTGWAGSSSYTNSSTYYGFPLPVGGYKGGPLFFSHYSYMGFDPRGIKDAYTNYFHRNTYHTLINRQHCIVNLFNRQGYNEECWGLTASDDPFVGYLAHEPGNANLDNGTIAPTAALSSMPYAPHYSMQALKHFYRDRGHQLWGYYGFYDAFNPGANWVSNTYLAIDQGPIICMIENYRSQLLWNNFMANPEIQTALDAIGFTPDSTVISQTSNPENTLSEVTLFPNPAKNDHINVSLTLKQAATISIELYDTKGTLLRQAEAPRVFTAGIHYIHIATNDLLPGQYWMNIRTDQTLTAKPFFIIK